MVWYTKVSDVKVTASRPVRLITYRLPLYTKGSAIMLALVVILLLLLGDKLFDFLRFYL